MQHAGQPTEPRKIRTKRHEVAFGIAVGLGAFAVVAFLPLRQGSTFGYISSLVGLGALLSSLLALGWSLSAHAGRGFTARTACYAVAATLLDLLATSTLISHLAAF